MRTQKINYRLLFAISLILCLLMAVIFSKGALAVAPGKATPVTPMGTVYVDAPTYKWNAVSDSTWYFLWVDDSSGTPIKKWYRATDAGCGNGSGLCSITPNTALTLGSGEWWVQTWNSDGAGSWSKPLSFTVAEDENLILNGDFEANSDPFFPDVPPNGWNDIQTHALGGWTVANTFPFSANFPPGLEIWDTWSGYPAANGTQHIELDGNDPTTILQRPATTKGNCYELSYAWSPRPGWEDNQIKVYVDGVEVAYHIASGLDNITTLWIWETLYFRATTASTTVAFAEVGVDDQFGMLLDKVSLKECPLVYMDFDIKPGSDPNIINLKTKRKIPVAILTTEDFDANDVDPDTCVFANANPVGWKMKDVDKDRDDDMLFYFEIRELDLTKESTEATLECETFEGIQITGTDLVKIVKGN